MKRKYNSWDSGQKILPLQLYTGYRWDELNKHAMKNSAGVQEQLEYVKVKYYKPITLEELDRFLNELRLEKGLKEEDLFGIPFGCDPVEFDKAMRKEVERRYGK